MTLEAINAAASSRGWAITPRHYDETYNRLGLAGYRIVQTDPSAAAADHDSATVEVVEDAWSDDALACSALDFLKIHAPESYVQAIYLAHQTPYGPTG